MEKLTNLFKVLSDETRLRILVMLFYRKLCVCQMQGILEESQPKISKHLGRLRDMKLVSDERQEQFIFYFLNKDNRLLEEVLQKIVSDIENYPVLKNDIKRLQDADSYIIR